jgi:MerC mercury resistance protein
MSGIQNRWFNVGLARPQGQRLDRLGIWVSLGCAIHCIVTPLLLGVLSLAGITWMFSKPVEWLIVLASLSIGLLSLIPSYSRLHKRKRCLILFASGAALLIAGKFVSEGMPGAELPAICAGVSLIIAAHWTNCRLCAACFACNNERTDEH